MKIEKGIAAAFDGTGVEEPTELAIPEKKSCTRNPGSAEYNFFGMKVELNIETIKLRYNKNYYQQDSEPPS